MMSSLKRWKKSVYVFCRNVFESRYIHLEHFTCVFSIQYAWTNILHKEPGC